VWTLEAVACADVDHAWAVGDEGTILATTDGGAGWNAQTSGTIDSLYGVAFVDTVHGWAVGDNGTIRVTTNGGATWGSQSSGTTNELYGVAFTNAHRGWAVGEHGTIVGTADGAGWRVQSSGVSAGLYGVAFADGENGWAVGDDSAIVATTTGGRGPDLTPPSTTASGADSRWHDSDVHIAFSATDDNSGMYDGLATTEYQIDSGDWTAGVQATVPAPADHSNDGVHQVNYKSCDAAGIWETARNATVKIDTVAPTTTISSVPAGWVNHEVSLTFSGSDDRSGLSYCEYQLNGGAFTKRDSVTVSGSGVTTIGYHSVDSAGNAGPIQTATVRIDTGKPTCTASKGVTVKKGSKVSLPFILKDPAPSCGAATVTITIKRATKVVQTITLQNVRTNRAGSCSFKVKLARGSYTWRVKAVDVAGNVGATSAAKKLTVT
jgi:photosystem II stability/assembly factor-like uncharacterized protein